MRLSYRRRYSEERYLRTKINKLETKAIFEAVQYRQDVFDIASITTTEKTSLPIHVVQNVTIIRAQKIGKFAV